MESRSEIINGYDSDDQHHRKSVIGTAAGPVPDTEFAVSNSPVVLRQKPLEGNQGSYDLRKSTRSNTSSVNELLDGNSSLRYSRNLKKRLKQYQVAVGFLIVFILLLFGLIAYLAITALDSGAWQSSDSESTASTMSSSIVTGSNAVSTMQPPSSVSGSSAFSPTTKPAVTTTAGNYDRLLVYFETLDPDGQYTSALDDMTSGEAVALSAHYAEKIAGQLKSNSNNAEEVFISKFNSGQSFRRAKRSNSGLIIIGSVLFVQSKVASLFGVDSPREVDVVTALTDLGYQSTTAHEFYSDVCTTAPPLNPTCPSCVCTTSTPMPSTLPPTTTFPLTTVPVNPCNGMEMDIVLLIDQSDGTSVDDFAAELNYLASFVSSFKNIGQYRTRVAAVSFASSTVTEFQFSESNPEAALRSIKRTMLGNATVSRALEAAKTLFTKGGTFKNQISPAIVLMLSEESLNITDAVGEAVVLRQMGVDLFTVSYNKSEQLNFEAEKELLDIAGTDENVFRVVESDELGLVLPGLIDRFGYACNIRSACEVADIVLVIEESQNANDNYFDYLMTFITTEFIERFDIGHSATQFACTGFSSDAVPHFDLIEYSDESEVMNALSKIIVQNGDTNTAAGLTQAFDYLDKRRTGVPAFVILFTGHRFDDGYDDPTKEANKIKQLKNTRLITVGMDLNPIDDVQFIESLKALASTPSDFVFYGPHVSPNATQLYSMVTGTTCTNLVTTPMPTLAPCTNGNGDLPFLDISFAIDMSTYTSHNDFERIKLFMSQLVMGWPLGNVQVGVLSFGDTAEPYINLGDFNNTAYLRDRISQLFQTSNDTSSEGSLAQALDGLSDMIFDSSVGDRSNADNVAIIFTNGKQNSGTFERAAARLRNRGILILAVGISDDINQDNLLYLTDDLYNIYVANGYNFTYNMLSDIQYQTCNYVASNMTTLAPSPDCCACPSTLSTPEPVSTIAPTRVPYPCLVDLVYIVDGSESIHDGDFATSITFIQNMTKSFYDTQFLPRFAALQFASEVNMEFYLNDYHTWDDYETAIDKLKEHREPGATVTGLGLQTVCDDILVPQKGFRQNEVPTVVILLTDGKSTKETVSPAKAADCIRAKNVTVFVISVGPKEDLNVVEIFEIAGNDSSHIFELSQFSEFDRQLEYTLTDVICAEKIVTPSSGPCKLRSFDVAFLIDESESVTESNFINIVKPVLKNMSEYLFMNDSDVRISMSWFSSDSTTKKLTLPHASAGVDFSLNAYSIVDDVIDAINNTVYHIGVSKLGEGLELVKDNIFITENGMRPEAEQILIIFSDGHWEKPPSALDPIPIIGELRSEGIDVFVVGGFASADSSYQNMLQLVNADKIFYVDGTQHSGNNISMLYDDLSLKLANITDVCSTTMATTTVAPKAKQDILFLVDESETALDKDTFRPGVLDFMQNLTEKVMEDGSCDVQVGLFRYSNEGYEEFGLQCDKDDVIRKISDLNPHIGSADLRKGFESIASFYEQSTQRDAERIIILLIRAPPAPSLSDAVKAADTLRNPFGAQIISVAYGNLLSTKVLDQISGITNSSIWQSTTDLTLIYEVANSSLLSTVVDPIADQLAHQNPITSTAPMESTSVTPMKSTSTKSMVSTSTSEAVTTTEITTESEIPTSTQFTSTVVVSSSPAVSTTSTKASSVTTTATSTTPSTTATTLPPTTTAPPICGVDNYIVINIPSTLTSEECVYMTNSAKNTIKSFDPEKDWVGLVFYADAVEVVHQCFKQHFTPESVDDEIDKVLANGNCSNNLGTGGNIGKAFKEIYTEDSFLRANCSRSACQSSTTSFPYHSPQDQDQLSLAVNQADILKTNGFSMYSFPVLSSQNGTDSLIDIMKNISTTPEDVYPTNITELPEVSKNVSSLVPCETPTEDVKFRVDCHPEPGTVTKEQCENRGCIFDRCSQFVKSAPKCYFSNTTNTNRYKVDGVSDAQVVNLTLDTSTAFPPLFSDPIARLQLSYSFFTDDILQVKIVENDASDRFDVENVLTKIPTLNDSIDLLWPLHRPVAQSSSKSLQMNLETTENINFEVQRNSTSEPLLKLENFIFEDQYIQFSTPLPSDYLYGIGENIQQRFKHDFTTFTTWPMFARDQAPWAVPTDNINRANYYGVHPFFMVREPDGNVYGILLLNSNAQEIATIPGPGLVYRTIGGVFNLFIFAGPTPDDVTRQYWKLIGQPILPDYWALGFQQCRWGYKDLADVEAAYNRTVNSAIPLDAQYVDIDYMDRYKDFTYDRDNFGELPQFTDKMHIAGRKLVLIVDPGINVVSEAFNTAESYGPIFVTWDTSTNASYVDRLNSLYSSTNGTDLMLAVVWPDNHTAYPDFLKTDTTDWWMQELYNFRQNVPFDGIWIDMNEPSSFGTNEEDPWYFANHDHPNISTLQCPTTKYDNPPYKTWGVYYWQGDDDDIALNQKTLCMTARQGDGGKYRHYDVHSLYGLFESASTVFGVANATGGDRFVLSRSSFVTSGQVASHWLGDNFATFDDLRTSLVGVMLFNMFGIPHVGADICGFNGDTTAQLCLRWMQAGAFYPLSRNHNIKGAINQDPGSFNPLVTIKSKEAMDFRYSILPYLYTLHYQASYHSQLVVKSLFSVFPEDPIACEIDEQFMWGDALMVQFVTRENQTQTTTYFPKSIWYSLRHSTQMKVYATSVTALSAGLHKTLDTPLTYMLPVFIRGGHIIPGHQFSDPGISMTTDYLQTQNRSLLIALDDNQASKGILFIDGMVSYVISHTYAQPTFDQWDLSISYSDNITSHTLDEIELFGIVPSASSDSTWAVSVSIGSLNEVPIFNYHSDRNYLAILSLGCQVERSPSNFTISIIKNSGTTPYIQSTTVVDSTTSVTTIEMPPSNAPTPL